MIGRRSEAGSSRGCMRPLTRPQDRLEGRSEDRCGAYRGMERRPLQLGDIPPRVSAQRCGQIPTLLSAKNADSEYIDLGRRIRGAN